jgi:hypothetical protein
LPLRSEAGRRSVIEFESRTKISSTPEPKDDRNRPSSLAICDPLIDRVNIAVAKKMNLYLRKVVHPQAQDNYRVVLKLDEGEFEIGSIGIMHGAGLGN